MPLVCIKPLCVYWTYKVDNYIGNILIMLLSNTFPEHALFVNYAPNVCDFCVSAFEIKLPI
jgi:hypothetical protein